SDRGNMDTNAPRNNGDMNAGTPRADVPAPPPGQNAQAPANPNPDQGVASAQDRNNPDRSVPAADRTLPADKNTDRVNDNMATVFIPGSHGMMPCVLHFANETTLKNKWVLDVPQSLDAQKIHDNLLNHLTKCRDMKDQWPADKD